MRMLKTFPLETQIYSDNDESDELYVRISPSVQYVTLRQVGWDRDMEACSEQGEITIGLDQLEQLVAFYENFKAHKAIK